MKKTNYFRIQLFDGANSACETAALYAARSNGGDKPLSLKEIATITEGERLKWQILCPDTSVELIGDSLLHIDTKVGNEYKTVCIIEECELFELPEVDDIPESLYRIPENGFGALAE